MPATNEFLESLIGNWEGTCRTWFEPGKPADESAISGTIQAILGGVFLRHTYQGSIQGLRRSGEETIAYNSVTGEVEISWIDDFHMNYGIMVQTGPAEDKGFTVRGTYAVTAQDPRWGWKTVYSKISDDRLVITAFNVSPEGQEGKAVETIYRRSGA